MFDRYVCESVARATGESVLEVSRRGFHLAAPLDVRFDPEPTGRLMGSRDGGRRSGAEVLDHAEARGRRPSRAHSISHAICADPLDVVEVVDLEEYGIDWDRLLEESGRPCVAGEVQMGGRR